MLVAVKMHWLETIPSTNAYALSQLDQAADPRQLAATAYASDHQTAGRGRGDHQWQERAGLGLALSVIVDTAGVAPARKPSAVHMVGLAVTEQIRKLHRARLTAIGWPNDVLIGGFRPIAGFGHWRKVAGILCQLHESGMLVIGVGINCLHRRDELAVAHATSLRDAADLHVTAQMLAEPLAERIESMIGRWRTQGGDLSNFLRRLNYSSAWLNKRVLALQGTRRVAGQYLGIDAFGTALILTNDGIEQWVSGEVRHLRLGITPPESV